MDYPIIADYHKVLGRAMTLPWPEELDIHPTDLEINCASITPAPAPSGGKLTLENPSARTALTGPIVGYFIPLYSRDPVPSPPMPGPYIFVPMEYASVLSLASLPHQPLSIRGLGSRHGIRLTRDSYSHYPASQISVGQHGKDWIVHCCRICGSGLITGDVGVATINANYPRS